MRCTDILPIAPSIRGSSIGRVRRLLTAVLWVRVPPPELKVPHHSPSGPDRIPRWGREFGLRAGRDPRREYGHGGEALDKRAGSRSGVVSGGPGGQLARVGSDRRLVQGAFDGKAQRSGEMKRHGSRTPAPAQSRRAAFSFMSPATGQATTAQPLASARTSVP